MRRVARRHHPDHLHRNPSVSGQHHVLRRGHDQFSRLHRLGDDPAPSSAAIAAVIEVSAPDSAVQLTTPPHGPAG
jgi:hypothetical protein